MLLRKPVMTISLPKNSPWGKTSSTRTPGSVDSRTEMEETILESPLCPPSTFALRREGSLSRSPTLTLISGTS